VPSSPEDIRHLLRRSGFVAADARVSQLAALDWPAAVEAVLDTSANPADDPPQFLTYHDENQSYAQYQNAVWWWIDRMVSSPTPIVEKMTLFWHGHFTSSWSKVFHTPSMVNQNRYYRANALGDFATLSQGMAVQPAMLDYLDNQSNRKGSPNQNFARELMELFMMGVGNYTEADVDAAARAWTGHTFDYDAPLRPYVFDAAEHDFGDKTFLGRTANFDGPDVIGEMLSTKRSVVARFMANKLWEFFAYQRPAPTILDDLVAVFTPTLDVKALLRALFNHPQFRSDQARQGLVRTPVEYVVAVLSGLGRGAEQFHPEWHLENMGQELWNPPNVSGWRPNAYWVNTSAFTARAEFAQNAGWKLREEGFWDDVSSLSPEVATDRAAATFGIHPLSVTSRTAILNWFASCRAVPFQGWSEPWSLFVLTLLAPELHTA
jgi:uncharacterized protein (DUF1800 family)